MLAFLKILFYNMRSLIFTFASAFVLLSTTYAQNKHIDTSTNAINALASSDELIISLQKELQVDSLNTAYWLMLGNAWEVQLNFDNAYTAYHYAVLSDSTCIKCVQQLAGATATQGDINHAIKLYKKALTLDSTNISTRSQLARLLKRDARYGDALNQFTTLLMADSTNYYVWEQIGDCALKTDSIALGLYAYSKSFELKPQNLPLAVKLINGLIKVSMPYYEIFPIAETAIAYDSTYIPIVRAKGYLHYLDQDYMRADYWFDKTTALGDSSRFTLKFSGLSKYQTGNYYIAAQTLEKTFAYDTTDKALNFVYAKALIEIGDRQKAVAILNMTEELLTPSPYEMAMLYATRGDAYSRGQKYRSAIEQFKTAYNFNSDQNEYLYRIGWCHHSAKEYKQAIDVLTNFLEKAEQEEPPKPSTQNRVWHAKRLLKDAKKEAFFNE
jgi:tetratricopeptide (TPR) repeat protein